ncbi:MAG TPA: glycoside hydrolase family 3 N-terminal domain-containing protein, partial [Sphingobacteriaceae bacterium]|nr:glycoside hydrolase family 3 N-terminal domain-containing protein [Sphingobacteriaceae bacterium]
ISKPIVTGILKEKLGFQGLIFTDAMDMQGVVKFFGDGEADLQAFIAGVDLLELSENSERAIGLVLEAIESGRIDQASIDQRVKKVLASKYWLGLTETKKGLVNPNGLYEDLNRNSSLVLQQQLADAAITVLRGSEAINSLNTRARTAIVSIGEAHHITDFQCGLGNTFTDHLFYAIPGDASSEEIQAVLQELKGFDQILVGVHDSRSRPRNTLNYTDEVKNFITSLVDQNAIFAAFTNPYALAEIEGLEHARGFLVAYQNEPTLQRAVVKALTGKISPNGKLPVTINEHFKSGDGL